MFSRFDEALGCLRSIDPERARAVSSHMTMGMAQYLPQRSRFVTILRDPVQRTLSHYSYLFAAPDDRKPRRRIGQGLLPPGAQPPAPGTPLADVLANPQWLLDNLQTRLLCGILRPYDELPPDALDRARTNLRERFSYVGVLERFDELVALLTVELDWRTYVYKHGRVNPARATRDQLSDEDVRLVEEHNKLDRELYGTAVELFEQAVQRAPDEVAFETEVLRRARSIRDGERVQLRRDDDGARLLAARALLAVRETELSEEHAQNAQLQSRVRKLQRRVAKLEASLQRTVGSRVRRALRRG